MKQQSFIRSLALTTTALFPLDTAKPIPANADPVTAAVAAAVGSTAVATFIVNTLASFALSALAMALSPKPKFESGGITTDQTTAGETEPQKIILGTYATNGGMVSPAYTYSGNPKKPNQFLVYITSISDLPITGIESVIIDDEEFTLSPPDAEGEQGVDGRLENLAWFRFFNGDQTSASSYLVETLGIHEARPWTTNHVLKGIAYAVGTFSFDQEEYSGLPNVRYVVKGAKLYDPRKDSSVGGSGTQRYGTESTYAFTDNPVVIIYNILRGIKMPDGSVYGIGAGANALPLTRWFAAMNVCDEPGTETGTDWKKDIKRYRAGIEISLDQEPLEIIDELLKSCGALLAEHGGLYNIAVGGASLPVAHITDDQIIISDERSEQPFKGLTETINTVRGTYPDPRNLWEPSEAKPFTKAEWVAEDSGMELVADVKLAAVPYPRQARRLMREMANDHRRRRIHTLTLPPAYMGLVPLDTITWTSPDKFYSAKAFEVQQVNIDPMTLNVQVSLRERDPADYDLDAVADAIIPTFGNRKAIVPVFESVPGLAVSAVAVKDATGKSRIPAIQILWDGDNNYNNLIYEIRLQASPSDVIGGSTSNTASGKKIVSENILPASVYEVRARVKERKVKSVWSAWLPVTTLDIKVGIENLATEVLDKWDESLAEAEALANAMGIQAFEILPASGDRINQIVLKLPDLVLMRWDGSNWVNSLYAGVPAGYLDATKFAAGIEPVTIVTGSTLPTVKSTSNIFFQSKSYRWNGTAYVSSIPTTDLTGTIGVAQFAQTLRPVEVVSSLPTTGNFAGRTIFHSGTGKIMRYSNGAFTAEVAGADIIANSITAGQIQAGAIGATEIAADAITARNIAISDFTNLIPDSELNDLASWTVTSGVSIIPAPSTAWGFPKIFRLVGASEEYVTATSKTFPVVQNEELHIVFTGRRVAGTGGSAGFQIRFSATANMGDSTIVAVPSVSGTSVERNSQGVVVPAGMYFAHVLAVKNPGATEVNIGGLVVRRKAGGSLIVDGAISTNHLQAEIITANNIAANAVTFGKVAAGAIGADQIVSNSLTSRHIAIGDFTNHASGSDFEDAALIPWTMPTSNNRNSSQAKTGSYSLQLTSTDQTNATLLTPIDCAGGDQFYASLWALRGSSWNGTSGNSKLRFYDFKTGGLIGQVPFGAADLPSSLTWYKKEGLIIVPAGCTKMGVQIVKDATAGACHLDDIEIRRKNAGNLIVDGTIEANHIKFGSLTGDNIAANTIFGSQLVAGSITANSAVIANGAIISAKIANAAIQSLHVANAAITTAKIDDAAITTAKIGNLQVDTLQIKGNAVTTLRKVNHGGASDGSSDWTPCGGVTFTPDINGDLVVWLSCDVSLGWTTLSSSSATVQVRYVWRGNVIATYNALTVRTDSGSNAIGPTSLRFSDITSFASGGTTSGTFQLQVRRNGGSASTVGSTSNVTYVIGEFKK